MLCYITSLSSLHCAAFVYHFEVPCIAQLHRNQYVAVLWTDTVNIVQIHYKITRTMQKTNFS